ncbi:MAG: hypothetical protein ABSF77_10685 [Spirochaetia bacterium]|jgi:hypothetical protein
MIVFLILTPLAFSANIIVPSMELITHGATNEDGVFALQTYGDMSLEVQGGYKFGGSIAFNILNPDLENLLNPPTTPGGSLDLGFLSASISIRDLFALPLTFSYFVGQNDTFCSGDGFTQFGVQPIMTMYRGFMYFPTGPLYDGIYQVQGTGAHLEFTPKVELLSFDLYLYEDTRSTYEGNSGVAFTSLGNYSGDFRVLFNFPAVKLEGFLGGTYSPLDTDYFYRGGVLFYATNRNVEFLAQIGIPKWDPSLDPTLNVDLFYLLVEPRLHLGMVSIVPTFFWHPGYYMQAYNPTELGTFDVNLNITLGDLTKNTFEGGMEGNLRFSSSAEAFVLKASPWVGFSTPGVLWTVKVNAKLWPFSLTDMLDAFVGVRAEF